MCNRFRTDAHRFSGNYGNKNWQSFFFYSAAFLRVGRLKRGNKINFNLGLGCQSSNWFGPDLMLLIRGKKKWLPIFVPVISRKSMCVCPESVTHLVVKLFNVKSKFDYIDKNRRLRPFNYARQLNISTNSSQNLFGSNTSRFDRLWWRDIVMVPVRRENK
jgi:hypothetical protein